VRNEQGAVTVPVDEKPHRKLKVWQASMDFVVELYGELQGFPAHEKFGLVGQLQRAAVSIPSNIAEGAARKNTRELLQFLYIARGSVSELDTQLEICFRIGYMQEPVFLRLRSKLSEISKMLNGLIASLGRKD
jgi:four helix bundle protein